MAENLRVKHGNYFVDFGFTSISNLLLDYQEELGIDDTELLFFIKVSRFSKMYTIKNASIPFCDKTIQRIRKRLTDKGYLSYTVISGKNSDGTFYTEGCKYDFSGLNKKLSDLASTIKEEKEEPEGTKVPPEGLKVPTGGTQSSTGEEPKSVYNKTTNKNIKKTTTPKSSSEKNKLKNILVQQAESIELTLGSISAYYGYEEDYNYSNLNKYIASLKQPEEKEVTDLLKEEIINPQDGEKIPASELFTVLGDYTVDKFMDNQFNDKNGDLIAYSFGLFTNNKRRMIDLVEYYNNKKAS